MMLIKNCISCDIVAGKVVEPGGVIYEDAFWHVGSSMANPSVWPGFLIIKLKRHCEHLAELTPDEASSFGSIARATCLALTQVLHPEKVYLCSFGDGIKHIPFWALPRPGTVRPGMHSVVFTLDMRMGLTRYLGIKRWMMSTEEVKSIAEKLRESIRELL